MYEIFQLNEENPKIIGYHWSTGNPLYIVCQIHGIGDHASRYDRIGEIFKEAGIAMISMDLRGHGLSSGKRGHTAPREDILSDIDKLIYYAVNQYENLPVVLYGHSMGGNIAMDYKRRGKLKDIPVGYIATAPWIILVRKIPCYLYKIVYLLAKIKPDFLINTNIKNKDLGNREIISKLESQHLMHGKISVKTAIEGLEIGRELINDTLEKSDEAVHRPLLLMHGDADKICSIEGSRKIAELEKDNCNYIEWKGLLHEIHNGNDVDDGRDVIMMMVNWIKKLNNY